MTILFCALRIATFVGCMAMSAFAFAGANVLDHTMRDIDGNEVDLSEFKGNVVMIVNVASKCGLTYQYEDLRRLHRRFAPRGFAVLAFPANNFANQEPGTDAEIKEFCTTKYNVQFPLFSKISVTGEDQTPLYRELTSFESNGEFAGEILWNFTKFLVNREGRVVARFRPRLRPDMRYVQDRIEEELGPEPAETGDSESPD